MPLYEYRCDACQDVVEKIARMDAADPACEKCGAPRKKCISGFGIVFTGELTSKYNDPKKERAHMGGHWVRATDPRTGKKTVPVFIDTFQKQQREYCKQEGLYNPNEIGQMEAHADGKSYSSRGLPGSW